ADAAGDPVGAARRDGQRLSDHRPRQRAARRPGAAASRRAERAAADRDADLHQSGPHGGRGDPGGDGVLLAGPRRALLPGAQRARSAAGAGAVLRVRRRGDRDEHPGRSDLSAARPPGGPMTTTENGTTKQQAEQVPVAVRPRALAWRRRRATVARFSRQYRTHRAGLFGLGALLLFALLALT